MSADFERLAIAERARRPVGEIVYIHNRPSSLMLINGEFIEPPDQATYTENHRRRFAMRPDCL
jgi:hypothetical protein